VCVGVRVFVCKRACVWVSVYKLAFLLLNFYMTDLLKGVVTDSCLIFNVKFLAFFVLHFLFLLLYTFYILLSVSSRIFKIHISVRH
jgi:hypothetical protein